MSMDKTIYLGPYLKTIVTPYTHMGTILSCQNKDCKNHKIEFGDSTKFCSLCGTKISKMSKVTKQFPDVMELFEIDRFCSYNRNHGNDELVTILMPNHPVKGIERDIYDIQIGVMPIDPTIIEIERTAFHKQYNKEILALESKNVEYYIEWGLVIYYI